MYTDTHRHTQTHTDTHTQTHRHTDTQTHRHTDTQTHTHTHTQAARLGLTHYEYLKYGPAVMPSAGRIATAGRKAGPARGGAASPLFDGVGDTDGGLLAERERQWEEEERALLRGLRGKGLWCNGRALFGNSFPWGLFLPVSDRILERLVRLPTSPRWE